MGTESHLPKYGEGPKREIVTNTAPPPAGHEYEPDGAAERMVNGALPCECGEPIDSGLHR